MPKTVRHWRQTCDTASPELKALLEKQITSTAYQTLGDFRNKVLLSLPPESKAKGSINLGTIVYDKDKHPFGISESELLQNMSIFGRSGSGKTSLAGYIITQLDRRGVPYLFFDNKKTLRHLIPRLRNRVTVYTPGRSLSKFSFNPFVTPPGLESAVYVSQLVDVLASSFNLGVGSRSILQKAITACYDQGKHSPLVEDIVTEIESMESKERVKGWKISALRALETLSFSNITTSRVSQEELSQRLVEGNTIIELDGLGDSARSFLISMLYQWIFQVKLCSAVREKLTLSVFIDEAHLVFDNRSGGKLMERLLRQTRELGIGTIVMDQTPSLMSKVVLANCYTNIFLNLVSASDLSKAGTVCLFDANEKTYFSMLPVGQGIIKLQDRWVRPFSVKFPHVDIQKGAVTDKVLAKYLGGISLRTTHSPGRTSVLPISDVFRQIPCNAILNESALQFLHDVITYPQDGVRERYRRLGFGDKKGHQIKKELLYQGWIEDQMVELGKTRKVLLRLTKQAREALGLDAGIHEYGSLVHEYWKRFYARKCQSMGYHTAFEVPRGSGRVDLVAHKQGERIAIEVETGKSNAIRNVQQDLLSGYDRIVIVATTKQAFQKTEKQLAREGLLIPGRVDLAEGDGMAACG